MKVENKEMIRRYLIAINFKDFEFESEYFPFAKLRTMRSLFQYVQDLEDYGLIEKFKNIYPFGMYLDNKLQQNLLDYKMITNIDLTESDKEHLNDFAEKASNKLTRKI